MWIIGVTLGVAVFLSLPLLVPMHLVFSSERGAESRQTRVTVRWLFGLIRFSMIPRRRPEEEKPKEGRRRPRVFFIALRTYGFAQRVLEFAKDLLRIVHVGRLRIDLRLGLPDPAETGMLAAVIMPAMALASPSHGIEVNVEPDFCLEGFAAQIDGELKVYPIALVMPAARLIFSAPTFRLVKAAVIGER